MPLKKVFLSLIAALISVAFSEIAREASGSGFDLCPEQKDPNNKCMGTKKAGKNFLSGLF